jgi:hypothetical protein
MLTENSVADCGWKIDSCFSRDIRAMSRCAILAIFFIVVYALPGLAQKALTLNDISDLIKNGVRPSRIAQLVEDHGVGFELDDRALQRLKQDGANDAVLSAVKKMSARYVEDKRSHGLQEARGPRKAKPVTELAQRRAQEVPTLKARQGAGGATLLTREEVGRVASLQNVASTEEGEVSGELVNHSKQTLREIRLQILYSWRWKNENHPGRDDPGRATYYVLDKEIPPGQTVQFNYKPSPPLASRDDGEFDISVKVAGFAQVVPPGAAR